MMITYGFKKDGFGDMKFNEGFTESSYFNIVKKVVEEQYSNNKPISNLNFTFNDDSEINAFVSCEKGIDNLTIYGKTNY